jgi:metal-responsive CopG/Arc/MetJ family transcriptional regulator
MVMPRAQILVQLDDSLLSMVDEQAAKMGASRSALIRRALAHWIATEAASSIDAAMVAGYERVPPEEISPLAQALAVASIEAEPW